MLHPWGYEEKVSLEGAHNEYEEIWRYLKNGLKHSVLGDFDGQIPFWLPGDPSLMMFCYRDHLVKQYSWAIPNAQAIDVLTKYSPIVEMGAGTGYWASLVKQNGGTIVCYDEYPPDNSKNTYGHTTTYHKVYKGFPRHVEHYPNHSLFLCWPSYATSFAYGCVKRFKGDTLIYVGEHKGGCNADDRFFNEMEKWDVTETVSIPQFNSIHDELIVWRR